MKYKKNNMLLIYISESARMFLRRIRVGFKGIQKYSGDANAICKQIIDSCYDKEKNYFMVSNSRGHFCEFYARDFGWCTEALISLGYKKEVINTLSYTLHIYEKHGRIEQSISPKGRPFTFPNKYSPDALAFLIRSLRLVKASDLIKKYKSFLDNEIQSYYNLVIDKNTGLVRKDKTFSSMKDHALRHSSCYDNVITGMLSNDLQEIKSLDNPFKRYNYKKIIVNNFWNGDGGYFLDDLSGSKFVCGDANVLPFWSGLINDKSLMKKAIRAIRAEGLDKPFPLKYASKKFKEHEMIAGEILASGYERNSIWAHIGLMYIKMVSQADKKLAMQYLDQYKKQIGLYYNFMELYDCNGRPFRTLLYHADESMLWCANYLYLSKKLLS
jgi:hypothetical protein